MSRLEDDELNDLEVLKEEDEQILEGGLKEFEGERVQGDRIHGSCDLAGLDLPQILPGDTNKQTGWLAASSTVTPARNQTIFKIGC